MPNKTISNFTENTEMRITISLVVLTFGEFPGVVNPLKVP